MTPKYIWMRPVLAAAITFGLLFLVGKLALCGLEQMGKEELFLFGALIQTIILLTKDCYAFYFGTSQGSANKSDTINELLNGGLGGASGTGDQEGA